MNHRIAGRANRLGRSLLLGGCFIGACLLFIAAFNQSDDRNREEGWVPLNAAMEEKLGELKEGVEANSLTPVEAPDSEADLEAGAERTAEAGGSPEAKQTEQADGGPAVGPPGDAAPNSPSADKADPHEAGAPLTSRDEAGRLDLNRATAAELDELKGIGPSKAKAIVEDRERNGYFASVDDLLRVKGIGEKLLAGIKDSVVTRP
ncbi:hypothetical protein D3P08_07545 [Paenibacillus nanensis]|uniref:Helix-hairpin-helix DNA-binding motif class 1 domain-containing protein n=1 Tax=Paenibacillus nanensis TaxID=393251 RepID=A0A3A1V0R4_9BACL|nr:ComEA family DNA-binding protein [Paenibacillus nanensis]RIX54095.1 hypothetical protein D3P08_07545 [Paenibacillus nanensis]